MTNETERTPPPEIIKHLNEMQINALAAAHQFEGARKMAIVVLQLEGDWIWNGATFTKVDPPKQGA